MHPSVVGKRTFAPHLCFEVIEGLDLDKPAMHRTVLRFVNALPAADAAVLFYSGLGLQVAGENYLPDRRCTRAGGRCCN